MTGGSSTVSDSVKDVFSLLSNLSGFSISSYQFKLRSWPGEWQCHSQINSRLRSDVKLELLLVVADWLRFVIITPTWGWVIGSGSLGFWDRRGWIRCEIKGLYSTPPTPALTTNHQQTWCLMQTSEGCDETNQCHIGWAMGPSPGFYNGHSSLELTFL